MSPDGVTLENERFSRAMRQLVAVSTKSVADEMRSAAKVIMTTVLEITPPAGAGVKGRAAENRGKAKIAADLIGSGSGSSRRGGIFGPMPDAMLNQAMEAAGQGDRVRLWVSAAGEVYGTQREMFRPQAGAADLRAQHKRYFSRGRMSRAGSYERAEGRWKWIDRMVVKQSTFDRYLKEQQRKVGTFAGGWVTAASALGARIPAHARRHAGSPGSIEQRLEGPHLRITVENRVRYDGGTMTADMERRLRWAIGAQASKIERRLPYLIRQAHKAFG